MTSVFGYCKADPNIPIDELDYGYIEKCKDINKLQKILEILRSGEEGRFPALEQFTEKQLAIKNPGSLLLERCNIEKTVRDMPKNEVERTIEDLKNFTSGYSGKTNSSLTTSIDEGDGSLPPIRTNTNNKGNTPKDNFSEDKIRQSVVPKGPGYWDKVTKEVDADNKGVYETVCQETKSKSSMDVKTLKAVHELLSDTPVSQQDDNTCLKAESDKNKGNEAFRCGDYEEALIYYNRSINISLSPAALNNRAITLIKLNRYTEALGDCEKVIESEPSNIKAYMRRGIANQSLGFVEKSCLDFEKVVELEPSNKRGKELLAEVKKELENKSPALKKKGTRMKIEEINTNYATEEINMNHSTEEGCEEKVISKEDVNVNPKNVCDNFTKNCAGVINSDQSCSIGNVMNCINSNKSMKNKSIISKMETNRDELVSSENSQNTNDGKDSSTITELPDNVVDSKNQGNLFFKSGRYDKACEMYTICIDTLAFDKEGYKSALSTFYSNRSSCYSKMGNSKQCITDCENSLELNSSGKVFFKRACAYESIEKYIDAYRDYEYAFKMDYSSASVLQALSRLGNDLRLQYGEKWRDKLHKTQVEKHVETKQDYLSNKNSEDIPKPEESDTNVSEVMVESPVAGAAKTKPIKREEKTDTTQIDTMKTGITKTDTAKTDTKKNESLTNDKKTGVKNTDVNDKPTCKLNKERLDKEKRILDFFNMKEKGNKLVRKANYEEAAKCYSQCVELLPKEIPSYTNRALCYLKLKQPKKAIEDCNQALKIQSSCVKALFRRAQARKMLKDYKEALADFAKVLKIEPNNNAAKNEADLCKTEFCTELRNIQAHNEAAKKKESAGKGKKVVIEEVDSTELPVKNKMSTKVGKCPLAKGSSQRNPSKKMTGFEFLHAWNNVKSDKTSDYADLLMQIDPTKLPDLLSNKLDGEVLKNFIRTINEHFTNKDTFKQGIQLLKSLCKVSRFVTMLMFLNTTEKTLLRSAIDQLEVRVKQSNEKSLLPEVNALKSSYHCS